DGDPRSPGPQDALLHARGRGARGGRRFLRGGQGQGAGAGGRERLRQDRHRLLHHGAGGPARPHRRGQDPVQGARPRLLVRGGDAGAAGQPHRHDLPGPDDDAQPGPADRHADDRDGAGARARFAGRGAAAGARRARPGRHPEPGRAAAELPAPVLRRDAPARRHRHRAAAQAGRHRRGRADHGARRDHPGADIGGGAEAVPRDRHGDDLDHARPFRGGRPRGRHRGDVRGPRGGAGSCGRGAGRAVPPLHGRAHRQRAEPQPARRAAAADTGHDAFAPRPARRLHLPRPLPARGAALRRAAAHGGVQSRPLRALHPPVQRAGDGGV
ncbi:MAG: ABC transporter, ATP-binding protein (cluster 5, nickel/peptides/opines), partial [uncultured Acetobacteraceae bacterium]